MKKTPVRALKPDTQMQDYVFTQASDLIRRAAFRASRVGVLKNAQAIHDLRVSIRRLSQCLRTFGQFFPKEKVRRVKRRLKGTMDLASEVRNHDVTLGFLRQAHLPPNAPLLKAIADERDEAAQVLSEELRLWAKKNIQKKWRTRLGL